MTTISDPNQFSSYWAQDDGSFAITGNADVTVLSYSANAMCFVSGFGDVLSAQGDTNLTVTDDGRGFSLIDAASTISVFDSQYDPTASVRMTRSLTAPTILPDGAGGTLIVGSAGSVDMIGNPNFAASQVMWG